MAIEVNQKKTEKKGWWKYLSSPIIFIAIFTAYVKETYLLNMLIQ